MSDSKPSTVNFTDKNLKRLKIRMAYNHSEGYKQTTLKITEVDAILNRLEAAEVLLANSIDIAEQADNGSLLGAWRRACGL